MIKSDERGLTIVELIIATAITGLIVSFQGTSIHQMFTVTEYGNDKLTANHELQNVAHWVSLDGWRASTATGGNELILTLTDGSTVTYTLTGTKLRRRTGGAGMLLAKNVSGINFSVDNRTITMIITVSPKGRDNVSENGTYQVYLRPMEEG